MIASIIHKSVNLFLYCIRFSTCMPSNLLNISFTRVSRYKFYILTIYNLYVEHTLIIVYAHNYYQINNYSKGYKCPGSFYLLFL